MPLLKLPIRDCQVCKRSFKPRRSNESVCSPGIAIVEYNGQVTYLPGL